MEKTETLTFRITPALKKALQEAAKKEHRSITNMVEKIILEHCKKNHINIPV